MIIGIAGPYSAETEEQRQKNLDVLNSAAARVLELGHIPLIGVNAALPVVEKSVLKDKYAAIMKISMTLINSCDALLLIKESPGANRERDLIHSQGKPVYYSIKDIPVSENL
jgi:hypothetical protein